MNSILFINFRKSRDLSSSSMAGLVTSTEDGALANISGGKADAEVNVSKWR